MCHIVNGKLKVESLKLWWKIALQFSSLIVHFPFSILNLYRLNNVDVTHSGDILAYARAIYLFHKCNTTQFHFVAI